MRVQQLVPLIAAEVCLLAACVSAQELSRDQRIVLTTRLVSMNVVVTDQNGRAVDGLREKHFRVFDNHVEQEITQFRNDDGPASIGVVFDLSGSMGGHSIEAAREAFERLVEVSHRDDEYFVFGFNSRVRVEFRGAPDLAVLFEKLKKIEPHGDTALYDTAAEALDAFATSRYQKRAIIILSDGEDNQSRMSLKELRRKIAESGVMVYTVLIGSIIPHGTGRAVLAELAASSGGRAFFPVSTDALESTFGRIANEIRRSYSIAFQPSSFEPDGTFHRIRVEVTPPEAGLKLVVRARKGYAALGSTVQFPAESPDR
jgi:Ca-activated chloride channel family protein